MQEALVQRLVEYHANVDAVKGCFAWITSKVDGTQPADAVTAAVLGACGAVLGNKAAGGSGAGGVNAAGGGGGSGAALASSVNVDKFVTRVIGPAVFLQVLSGSSALIDD